MNLFYFMPKFYKIISKPNLVNIYIKISNRKLYSCELIQHEKKKKKILEGMYSEKNNNLKLRISREYTWSYISNLF